MAENCRKEKNPAQEKNLLKTSKNRAAGAIFSKHNALQTLLPL